MTTRTKHIKVTKFYYDYKPKNAGPYSPPIPPVPWLQLKGKWLAKIGFTIDTPIKVEAAEGQLILTAEKVQDPSEFAGTCCRCSHSVG